MYDVLAHYLGVMLGAAIATALAMLSRRVSRSRFWSTVARDAKRMLDDPNHPINEPDDAAEQALLDAQRPSVIRVATRIANGAHPKE